KFLNTEPPLTRTRAVLPIFMIKKDDENPYYDDTIMKYMSRPYDPDFKNLTYSQYFEKYSVTPSPPAPTQCYIYHGEPYFYQQLLLKVPARNESDYKITSNVSLALNENIFSPGQAYIAFSRCSNFEISHLDRSAFMTDPDVIQEYQRALEHIWLELEAQAISLAWAHLKDETRAIITLRDLCLVRQSTLGNLRLLLTSTKESYDAIRVLTHIYQESFYRVIWVERYKKICEWENSIGIMRAKKRGAEEMQSGQRANL
ncbi:2748_t:CDS:2, partial [Gigaspora margarita]